MDSMSSSNTYSFLQDSHPNMSDHSSSHPSNSSYSPPILYVSSNKRNEYGFWPKPTRSQSTEFPIEQTDDEGKTKCSMPFGFLFGSNKKSHHKSKNNLAKSTDCLLPSAPPPPPAAAALYRYSASLTNSPNSYKEMANPPEYGFYGTVTAIQSAYSKSQHNLTTMSNEPQLKKVRSQSKLYYFYFFFFFLFSGNFPRNSNCCACAKF